MHAGFGPSLVRDLSQCVKHVPQPCEALARDVLRWLRTCSQGLVKHPQWVAEWRLCPSARLSIPFSVRSSNLTLVAQCIPE
jgi:hypothetical protein